MRLKEVQLETATPEQKEILLKIQKSRKGNLSGPFKCWVISPKFADVAQAVGKFTRYETGLDLKDSELVIITVAAYWKCNAEWQIHAPIAKNAGIDEVIINQIKINHAPDFNIEIEQILYCATKDLLENKRISDINYRKLQSLFSDEIIVNLIGLIGYYSMVALSLNTFEVVQEGEDLPFYDY